MGKPNPMKGIPRSEWPAVLAERKKAAEDQSYTLAAAAVAQRQEPVPAHIASLMQTLEPPKLSSDSVQPEALPPDLFSGTIKTLEVYGLNGSTTDPIPGFRLYWFNDVGGTGERLAQARRAGYDFVRSEEVALTDSFNASNVDPGGLVCKVVSPNSVPPTKAYLMKQPLALHQRNMADRDKQHQRVEQALALGRVSSAKAEDAQYSRADDPRSSLPEIKISNHLVR